MNRLNRHVELVRSKLTLDRFSLAFGYALAIFLAAGLVLILVDRFFWVDLPRIIIWIWAGIAATVLAAVADALVHRPSAHQAAVLIDAKLGLNEKFSTALYARAQGNAGDPFTIAAVSDAERTADNVSVYRRFPLQFPVSTYFALGVAVLVLLTSHFLPRIDLFDHHAKQAAAQRQLANRVAAEHAAQKVLTAVNSLPATVQNQEKVELAKKDLQRVLDQPNADPAVTKLTAMKAQEEVDAAKQEEMKTNPAVSQAMADKAVFNSMNPSADDQGPVADASKEIANGDFSKAADALQQLQQKFDQMTPQQQKTATDQMKNAAEQLQKIASDPAAMQHLQQQLQQQGISHEQSQQMAKAAQQTPQAQQKLQQMQKQATAQMNAGKGPTPQQQAQIQKTTQQMQAVANSQNKAQQMAKAAQQMVHGMQQAQASKQGGSKPGQQQANAKLGDTQKAGPMQGGQTPSGKEGGTEPANGSKPGGQQPGGQQPGTEMQQGGQQLAQSLGEMNSVQKNAQQQASGQNPNDSSKDRDGPGNNPGGSKPGPGGGGQGDFGQSGSKRGGGPGPGFGNGGTAQQRLAPYTVKQEIDPSQNIADGKVLSKTFVKADPIIGKSTIELSPQAKSAVKESTDDVSEDTVPKDAQKAVKDYFDTVQNGN